MAFTFSGIVPFVPHVPPHPPPYPQVGASSTIEYYSQSYIELM